MLVSNHQDAVDGGPRKISRGLERLCAATDEVKSVDHMIRFVIDPDQRVVPDLKGRLPGRGVWITATRQAIKLALRRKSFARSFKRDVAVACDLAEQTEQLLEQAALNALAMAHKAHKVAIGFGRVDTALIRERVVALLNAMEASAEGVRKLKAVLKLRQDAADIAVIDSFSAAQLDLALGRSNVIHAALLAGPESGTFLARAARLDGFRTGLPMAGPLAIGKHRRPRSAKAAGRRQATRNCDEKLKLRELDRDRNG